MPIENTYFVNEELARGVDLTSDQQSLLTFCKDSINSEGVMQIDGDWLRQAPKDRVAIQLNRTATKVFQMLLSFNAMGLIGGMQWTSNGGES